MAPSRRNPGSGPPPPEVEPAERVPTSRRILAASGEPPSLGAIGLRPRGEAKHRRIFDHLLADIESGQFKQGDRLPSEAELGKLFDASRITVAKAVLELQRRGLVTRRPGAGTHVRGPEKPVGHSFGLLVPELGQAEVLDRICQGLVRSPHARSHSFVWCGAPPRGDHLVKDAEQQVESLIQQKVAGVFFVPLELALEKDAVNHRVVRSLERSQIPVVLLDHDFSVYPQHAGHDLVAMDHRRAGFTAAAHMIKLGVRRLVILAEAPTGNRAEARIAGFREALCCSRLSPDQSAVWRGGAADEALIQRMLDEARPEGIVCADDLTAAHLMQTLLGRGVRIPEDLRLVGIDDMKYASLLPVPLSTVQQDFVGIGAAALIAMLDRIAYPALPGREILVPGKFIIRRSCGARAERER